MTKRIREICSALPRVSVFADVGCDHGYCTRYMFERGLCERAYVTDIGKKCLQKAESLLAAEIAAGKCVPVCCDGLSGVPQGVDCVLIAGMGGEEIVRILEGYGLPPRFVLQPMKNSEKVRAYLLSRGVTIERDYTFFDGKHYDLIAGRRGGNDGYTDSELRFGRDNLLRPSAAVCEKIGKERAELRALAGTPMSNVSRRGILDRLNELEVVLDAIENDL